MAERPKLTVKPQAPGRDPQRARVRATTAPRTSPKPRPQPDTGRAPEDAPQAPQAPDAAPRAPRVTPAQPERARAETRRPPPRDERPRPPRADDRPRPPHEDSRRRPPRADDGPRSPRPPADRRSTQAQPQGPVPARSPRAAAGAIGTIAPTPHADGLRVSKLMTDRGLSSRREADDWIEAGWVRVNGRLAVLGQRATADALIEIDAKARAEQVRRVTVLLHKPVGYVSGQAEDGHEPASVLVTRANHWAGDTSGIDLHAGHMRHLAPAGRLDIDSTGLLVLTQDGRVAKRLIGDETRVEKEYLVRVTYTGEGELPEHALNRLRHGMELDGVQLREAKVSWQNEDQLRFVLREGRKRQIRRMCEQVGLQVIGLKRVRIGSVALGPLPAGQWRFLRDDEGF